jgi:hypothetical protein
MELKNDQKWILMIIFYNFIIELTQVIFVGNCLRLQYASYYLYNKVV